MSVPTRWYVVCRDGLATLCKDEADAAKCALDYDWMYPRHAPHRAAAMGDVAAERERFATRCEVLALEYLDSRFADLAAELRAYNFGHLHSRSAAAELALKAEACIGALRSLDERLRACSKDPITAAEAYDSFYQEIVTEALAEFDKP